MNQIEALIQKSEADIVAVAVHDLQTGRELFIHADEYFHPASTFKVGVMMEVFHQAAQGQFLLNDEILVSNIFSSIADGSLFSTYAEDDSETSLYEKIGGTASLREIMRLMIVRSSNLATNILIQKVGAARTNAFMRELGIEEVEILRGPEDNKAYALGLNNSATARGLMQMMKVIAEGKAISPQACTEMIDILLQQEFNEGIPARLPSKTRVAHKTGWNDRLYHDFGIVFTEGRRPFVLAILTRGFKQESEAHQCAAEISESMYQMLVGS